MNKKDIQEYLDRWKLVSDAEEDEIRNASFESMIKQTFSIWDIGRSLKYILDKLRMSLAFLEWAELK